ncbi:phosphoribosylglycinamide formyltransferase [Geminocystis sp. NIES-3708]|uniref:phosphoribosylglycinamide formyltransferase n=1 Tax=Geminocystis sp. NIES-3708 TaxID=1615909 RepID=UPI0005FC7616|nr:phosphoribosylglycinamide formyltransferase [Geminocystis sp. NIES-3708]BAQ62817.1 phosphoribosylglycinamide formyltransferase [Geminocystis sp. NIES-3708]
MDHSFSSALVSPYVTWDQLQLNKTIKLGVMASGSGSNFEAIAQAINEGKLNGKVEVLIYNNPQAKAKERADKFNIPSVLLNHRNYPHREALDEAIVEVFKAHQVEWVVMAGWMRIITNVLLKAFPEKVINIHPSLLPSFKGINAIEKALKAKVKMTGCTVHLVDLEVDSGPILIQSAVPILPDDTSETLHHRIQIQEHHIITQGIALAVQREKNN